MSEQRHPYRGTGFPRPAIRLTFLARDGTRETLELLADTGNPYDLILSPDWFDRLVRTRTPGIRNNFGTMPGGWFQLHMPDDGLVELVRGFSSASVGAAVAASHPGFAGLVGLPVLRLGEYGGNADAFWFRYPPAS